jgi:multiple sugar transport system permease protein
MVALVLVVLWTAIPFVYLLLATVTPGDYLPRGFSIPSRVSLEHYRTALISQSILPQLLNSLFVGAVTTMIVIAVGVPAAYGFARVKTKTAEIIFYLLLVVRMIPDITFTVPIFFLMQKLHLLGTFLSICIVYSFWQIPFSIWLLRPFFTLLPYELEEAAVLDGATQMQILRKVIVPLLGPALAVICIFTFLACYIEYMYASFLTSTETMTLPVRLAQFTGQHKLFWGSMSAAVTVSLIPMVLMYTLGQKYIVRGLTLGAVK